MQITQILNIKWNYQMTEHLLAMLLDEVKRKEAFDRYLSTQPDLSQDCFLEEFQANFAQRDKLKQDYTPPSLCQLAANISPNAESVLDICAGTGALTIAKWATSPNAMFYCEEYSKEAIALLLFNLAVRGINAEIKHCDVLTGETSGEYRLTRNGKYSDITQTSLDWQNLKVDVVLSNPPYSLAWQPKADARFEGFDLPPKSKADYAFILHGLHRLNENGTAHFILPHGILFREQSEGKIRRALVEKNQLDSVIGLPENLFLATNIPVAILTFKKQRTTDEILFVAAQNLFTKGKPNNKMEAEHLQQIIHTVTQRKNVHKFATLAPLKRVEENQYNLNLPRYVDIFEEKEVPDFLKEAQDLLAITQELEKSQQQFLSLLSEIEIMTSSKKDRDEFDQAKECLKQAFAPRQFKTRVIQKIQHLNPGNYQATLFSQEELTELTGFIEHKEKQIATLKRIKDYFLAKLFV